MRVALVYPGKKSIVGSEMLALETLAATIPHCDVQLIDMRFEQKSLRSMLRKFEPHVVGTTAMSIHVYQAREVLRTAKTLLPNVFTMVGGVHGTLVPVDFNLPYVDAVVLGLGEKTFPELIGAIDTNSEIRDVPGLAIPTEQGLVYTPERPMPANLDEFPIPRRDLSRKYASSYKMYPGGDQVALISTTRGCPHRCSFCSIWKLFGKRFLARDPDLVVEEMAKIRPRMVHFAEGHPFANVKRMTALQERIAESGIKKDIILDVTSDVVLQHSDLLEKWKAAGLKFSPIGIEFVDDEKLRAVNKRSSVAKNNQAIEILHQLKVNILGHFQVDPRFTVDDFERVYAYIVEHDIQWPIISITTPLPGTDLYQEQKDEIVTDNYEYFDNKHAVVTPRLGHARFWKEYQRLMKRTRRYSLSSMPGLIRILGKTTGALHDMRHRKDHKMKKAPESDTELSNVVLGRTRPDILRDAGRNTSQVPARTSQMH